jgi:glucokinase
MSSSTRALGIDIGGTKIAIGELARSGESRELAVLPTAHRDGRANLTTVREAIARFAAAETPVGISLATTIDATGRVRDPRGWFGWTGLELAHALGVPNPIEIRPDAACGAVAEARWGAGAGARRVLYVTLGTGIAHCVVSDGVPDTGSFGAGILSGSTPPFRSAWRTRSSWLSVEDIASGPGLAAAFAGSIAATDAHRLADAFRAGDWWARRVVEHASWQLGSLIAGLATSTDPDRIVLGGGLAAGFPEYAELVDGVLAVLLHDWHSPLAPTVPAHFGAESCWIGAAGLAGELSGSPEASTWSEPAGSHESAATRKEIVDV